jgi:hypothetical protein
VSTDFALKRDDDFRELDRLSAEQQKARRRTRIRLGILVIFLVLMGLDYLVSWPKATRKQRALEHAVKVLPLPPATVQESVQTGHKPRSGFVSRMLLSSSDPRTVCAFFSAELTKEGWTAVANDCVEAASKADVSADVHTVSGYGLLSFAREGNTCSLRYYGYANGDRRKYAIAGTWGIR